MHQSAVKKYNICIMVVQTHSSHKMIRNATTKTFLTVIDLDYCLS